MAVDAQDISSALIERRMSGKIIDHWDGVQTTYAEWKRRVSDVDLVYSNQWTVLWPDAHQTDGLPRIPNLVQLASEDRARLVAAGNPSIVKRPSKTGDEAKKRAERVERVLAGYWDRDKVKGNIPRWAMDAMFSGVCAVKVLPDLSKVSEGRSSVYPTYSRINPRYLYPDPIFAEGPTIDNALIATIQKVRTVEQRYNVNLSGLGKAAFADSTQVRVIEFYDGDELAVLAQAVKNKNASSKPKAWEWLIEPTKHRLIHCPIVLGTRVTADDVYRGDFDGELAILNTWNRLMTLHMDAATMRVYPSTGSYDVENPEDWGPDSHLNYESKDAKFEFIQPPGAAFENHQLMRLMSDFARASSLLPEARSGDPSQSIISAAGVGAVNGMESDHVRSLQRDTIAPMLEKANELALCADEQWGDVEKQISGYSRGQAFTETYTPSKAIAGDYRNQVTYGAYVGADPINQNVMLLQNADAGMISFRSAREQSPLVEDPLREEKQQALEQLQKAILAGIEAGAAAPPGTPGAMDPVTIAKLYKPLQEEDKNLSDAVAEMVTNTPLAQPQQAALPSGVPGIAGAQAVQQPQPFNGPPLPQVLQGPRP
jgi:hypothetical protein